MALSQMQNKFIRGDDIVRSFLNGIVTGGIIGAIVGAFLIPAKKPVIKSKGRIRRLQAKVDELMNK